MQSDMKSLVPSEPARTFRHPEVSFMENILITLYLVSAQRQVPHPASIPRHRHTPLLNERAAYRKKGQYRLSEHRMAEKERLLFHLYGDDLASSRIPFNPFFYFFRLAQDRKADQVPDSINDSLVQEAAVNSLPHAARASANLLLQAPE